MADPVDEMQQRLNAMTDEQKKAQEELEKKAQDALKQNYYKYTLSQGLGIIGAVAGIIVAVKRKSGFWGGVGWFMVGSALGSGIGYAAGSMIDGKPKT